MQPLHTALKLPDDTPITITGVQHHVWGQQLTFRCHTTTPQKGLIAFTLRFEDCREQRWQLYTHMQSPTNIAFPECTLVDIRLGRNQHRSPAHMLTDYFGLSLVYGTATIIKDEIVQTLD